MRTTMMKRPETVALTYDRSNPMAKKTLDFFCHQGFLKLPKVRQKQDWKNIDKANTLLSTKAKARFQMNDNAKNQRMTVSDFFTALASNEYFIFAVAHTNSFKKNVKLF